jgi:hypothetical protein
MAVEHPTFKFTEDTMVHVVENLLADGGSMKQGPTANHRVELNQEFIHRRREISPEGRFDLGEESPHILTRRLDNQLAVVLLDVFAEKIEAIFNVRDASFTL